MARRLLLMAAVGWLSCAPELQLYYSPLSSPPRPLRTRPPDQVQIFSMAPPAWPYLELGAFEVHAQPDSGYEVLDRLRQAAASKGCDGLVLHPPRRHFTGLLGVEAVHLANCIVYLTPPPVEGSPAPAAPLAPAATK